jgi:hypothetical protein
MSYYLDYYVSQYIAGNFAICLQFWMDLELNELIEEGLQLLGAEKHLEFFNNNEESKVDE